MPKLIDHNIYKTELLEKCFELFCRRGYASVSMREIANELDISTGAMYHYFPTKLSILEQMFNEVMRKDVEEAERTIQRSMPLIEKLKKFKIFIKGKESYYQNLLLLAVDFYRNSNPKESSKVLEDFSKHFSDALAKNLDLPESIGTTLFVFILGLVYSTLMAPGTVILDEQLDIINEMLVFISNDS